VRAVNLLPREAPKRRQRPAVVVQLALVSPFVVGSLLAAGYLLASSKVSDNKATLQALQDDLATLPRPTPAPQVDTTLAVQRDQRIVALASALQSRVAWDRILREVSSILPEDAWLTTLSAQSPQVPAAAPTVPATTTTTTTTTTDTTTTSEGSGTTPAPAPTPAPPAAAPLKLDGYTYSQEGVARFLSRLAVIPDLQDVKLIHSQQTIVAGRVVVSFQIQASVRPQATA
jgi:Tfp pilus assembly protein PilN